MDGLDGDRGHPTATDRSMTTTPESVRIGILGQMLVNGQPSAVRFVPRPARDSVESSAKESVMSALKDRIRADLTTAMKARDPLVTGTLRMALAALTNEEVSGSRARELSDQDVAKVLVREVKKRNESAEVYAQAGRDELAANERSEIEVLSGYLPEQLSDDEVRELVAAAVAEVRSRSPEAPSTKQLGQVIRTATVSAAGRADGARVAAAAKAALAG